MDVFVIATIVLAVALAAAIALTAYYAVEANQGPAQPTSTFDPDAQTVPPVMNFQKIASLAQPVQPEGSPAIESLGTAVAYAPSVRSGFAVGVDEDTLEHVFFFDVDSNNQFVPRFQFDFPNVVNRYIASTVREYGDTVLMSITFWNTFVAYRTALFIYDNAQKRFIQIQPLLEDVIVTDIFKDVENDDFFFGALVPFTINLNTNQAVIFKLDKAADPIAVNIHQTIVPSIPSYLTGVNFGQKDTNLFLTFYSTIPPASQIGMGLINVHKFENGSWQNEPRFVDPLNLPNPLSDASEPQLPLIFTVDVRDDGDFVSVSTFNLGGLQQNELKVISFFELQFNLDGEGFYNNTINLYTQQAVASMKDRFDDNMDFFILINTDTEGSGGQVRYNIHQLRNSKLVDFGNTNNTAVGNPGQIPGVITLFAATVREPFVYHDGTHIYAFITSHGMLELHRSAL